MLPARFPSFACAAAAAAMFVSASSCTSTDADGAPPATTAPPQRAQLFDDLGAHTRTVSTNRDSCVVVAT